MLYEVITSSSGTKNLVSRLWAQRRPVPVPPGGKAIAHPGPKGQSLFVITSYSIHYTKLYDLKRSRSIISRAKE